MADRKKKAIEMVKSSQSRSSASKEATSKKKTQKVNEKENVKEKQGEDVEAQSPTASQIKRKRSVNF